MKFVVEVASKLSGRLGCLIHTETGQKFQTPLLLQTTKGGSIPHLTREVFKYVTAEQQILQICLASTDHMEEALKVFKGGLASFVGFPEFLTFVTLKDPSEVSPSGFHVKDLVPFFTRRGKQELSAQSYMDLIEVFKPNIYHALCDNDTDSNSSKKRVIKSVDRSEDFFTVCLERHKKSENLKNSLFFAPIVGGYNKHARSQSIKSVSKHPEVGGYIIDGLHSNGDTATKLSRESLRDVVTHCLNEVGADKPKMMMGAYTPVVVLELVRMGVDIFDTSYVYVASSNFQGLVFDYDLNLEKRANKLAIDLGDESYAEDFTPILDGCSCLACQKHTKAYINHLIKTRELLGPILLMIHNMHHYLQFFESIRRSISNDTLPDLVKLLEGCITEEKPVSKEVSTPPVLEQTEAVSVVS